VNETKPKSALGHVFGIVFLDIIGFSIIFPLFPAMLEYYLGLEGESSAVGSLIAWLERWAGDDKNAVAALFGGILGSLYSVLQFLFAPVWGSISDRSGRRPTLLVTLVLTVLSYVLWLFAGSFTLLILARRLGGIAAGNISTASAVVADTTTGADRAKGMGILGMAIGLGFVVGPALGALSSTWVLGDGNTTGGWGLHPFSGPAVIALGLSLLNLLTVATRFRETRVPGARTEGKSLNPFGQIRRLALPGVARANAIYFLYATAFSGIEFTLTFLVVERFAFSPIDNGWMFVYVGLVIAFVQGGLVRRLVPRVGERKLSLMGVLLTIPGFVLIGQAGGTGALYAGLSFMAVGSAFVMPCLSSLVSRYTPADRQGLSLGAFRSLGALSRAVGPILGGLCYWRFGSAMPYLVGALFLVLPVLLSRGLPPVPEPTE